MEAIIFDLAEYIKQEVVQSIVKVLVLEEHSTNEAQVFAVVAL